MPEMRHLFPAISPHDFSVCPQSFIEWEHMLKVIKLVWISLLAIVGAAVGAILIGGFDSIPLSILGAVVGLPIGALLGKYIPIYEWFV